MMNGSTSKIHSENPPNSLPKGAKSRIQQSMSRTGCPYDNAPIERYFNTLKHEQIYLFEYRTERELDAAVAEFAYAWYNRVRPHTFNGGLTPAALPEWLDTMCWCYNFAWPRQPNGIDDFWHNNKFNERTPPEAKTAKIIYVGQVNKNKNIKTTIAACNILAEKGYKVNFTVMGNIVNARYHRLLEQTHFLKHIPYCSKEELIKHYRDSDIFVMPSKRETFGLVYAEAMSQALPIVFSRGSKVQ